MKRIYQFLDNKNNNILITTFLKPRLVDIKPISIKKALTEVKKFLNK
jgi:hypothetical protein